MKTYEVTVRTTYTMEWTHTVEADNREDAVDEAAQLCEWDWSEAEEHNEATCTEITAGKPRVV